MAASRGTCPPSSPTAYEVVTPFAHSSESGGGSAFDLTFAITSPHYSFDHLTFIGIPSDLAIIMWVWTCSPCNSGRLMVTTGGQYLIVDQQPEK